MDILKIKMIIGSIIPILITCASFISVLLEFQIFYIIIVIQILKEDIIDLSYNIMVLIQLYKYNLFTLV